ncbi:hypothetical protein DPMN_019135 [Dreissena polymorpha]|uniref:Uncharacterized protein n=1 Tax=Dreissena polymorpha TaxID=45954 RepID=A0A9D4S903_DREPO|nr:hypothetical protein DPMN_019135 [Dreissena polymorpha]
MAPDTKVPDERKDEKTDGQRQNNIPLPLAGDNNNHHIHKSRQCTNQHQYSLHMSSQVFKRFTFIQNTKCTLLRGNFHKNGMLEPISTKVNNCSAGCPFQLGTTCKVQHQWVLEGQ